VPELWTLGDTPRHMNSTIIVILVLLFGLGALGATIQALVTKATFSPFAPWMGRTVTYQSFPCSFVFLVLLHSLVGLVCVGISLYYFSRL
jgi:hypothetical protein